MNKSKKEIIEKIILLRLEVDKIVPKDNFHSTFNKIELKELFDSHVSLKKVLWETLIVNGSFSNYNTSTFIANEVMKLREEPNFETVKGCFKKYAECIKIYIEALENDRQKKTINNLIEDIVHQIELF